MRYLVRAVSSTYEDCYVEAENRCEAKEIGLDMAYESKAMRDGEVEIWDICEDDGKHLL